MCTCNAQHHDQDISHALHRPVMVNEHWITVDGEICIGALNNKEMKYKSGT